MKQQQVLCSQRGWKWKTLSPLDGSEGHVAGDDLRRRSSPWLGARPESRGHRLAVCLALILSSPASVGAGQPSELQAPTPVSPSAAESATPRLALQRLGPGLFALGKITLDKTHRSVSFPARVNQRAGVVEYALVTLAPTPPKP